ncbi:MAG: ComF family protein [Patescibacteria group bacterium]
MFKQFLLLIKATLFPIYCVECGAEGEWWCKKCLARQEKCFGEFEASASSLDGAFAFLPYLEQVPAGKLIRAFKYNFASDIENVWHKVIVHSEKFDNFAKQISTENCMIVPVPLHHRRERERGYNQADVIARIVAKNCWQNKIPVKTYLLRVRYTAQQAKLNKKEREHNVLDAFIWQKGIPCPENIILVDDVFTTGATLESCAQAVRAAGAKKVFVITLGRAVFSKL